MLARARITLVVLAGLLTAAGAARPDGPTLRVTAVTVRSSSADVSWRAAGQVRAVVEYGTEPDPGSWSKASAPAAGGVVALGGLEPATTYRFRLLARDAGGALGEVDGSFTTGPIGERTVATTTANALLLDRQPVFPRLVFRTCPYYYGSALAAGVDVFMGSGCDGPHDQLAAVAGRAWSVLPAADAPAVDGRGLIGWYQPDEADGLGFRDLPQLARSAQSRRVTFLTVTDHFFSGSAPLPDGSAIYPRLVSRAEMVGFDLYPLQSRCRRDALPAVYAAQAELVRLAAGKPTYQWIEAGPLGNCPALAPTGATVQAEAWLAIAGGARGLGWFPDFWSPVVARSLAAVDHEITALSPALLGPARAVTATGPVLVGARTANGATLVIAVNPGPAPATATITVPGLVAATATVVGEGRAVAVAAGRYTDSFRPLAVHVYETAPSGW